MGSGSSLPTHYFDTHRISSAENERLSDLIVFLLCRSFQDAALKIRRGDKFLSPPSPLANRTLSILTVFNLIAAAALMDAKFKTDYGQNTHGTCFMFSKG